MFVSKSSSRATEISIRGYRKSINSCEAPLSCYIFRTGTSLFHTQIFTRTTTHCFSPFLRPSFQLVHSDTEELNKIVTYTASLAENISRKVKQLDLAKVSSTHKLTFEKQFKINPFDESRVFAFPHPKRLEFLALFPVNGGPKSPASGRYNGSKSLYGWSQNGAAE